METAVFVSAGSGVDSDSEPHAASMSRARLNTIILRIVAHSRAHQSDSQT